MTYYCDAVTYILWFFASHFVFFCFSVSGVIFMIKKEKEEAAIVLRGDVYQANPMIQARKDFGLMGMRIFFLGLQGINPHLSDKDRYYDEDFKDMFIPTNKLTKLFGNTNYLFKLREACIKLFDATVELNYADGGFKLMHMFEELEYRPRDGLYLQFSRKMRPYILDLFESRGYTRINISYLFGLSSTYAVRLFELLLQYQNIETFKQTQEIRRKFTIEELRFVLNVPNGAYADRVNNFRSRVLDVAVKEINANTPYIVRYVTVKEGRKVIAFEFTMDTFKVPIEELNGYKPNSSNDAIEVLKSMGFAERDAQAIFKQCEDVNDCFSRINRARGLLDRQKKPVRNRLGFLRKAIEKGWQVGRAPVEKQKTPTRSIRLHDNYETEETPVQKDISIGRKKIPYTIAKSIIDHLQDSGDTGKMALDYLKEFNVSMDKFIAACEKNGLKLPPPKS